MVEKSDEFDKWKLNCQNFVSKILQLKIFRHYTAIIVTGLERTRLPRTQQQDTLFTITR